MALKASNRGRSGGEWEGAIAWRMWCPVCGLESPAILGLLMPPRWQALEEPVAILRSTCARDHLTECLLNVSVLYEGGRVRAVGLGQAGCGYDKLWKEVGQGLISALSSSGKSPKSLLSQDGTSALRTIPFWTVWVLSWLKCWVRAVLRVVSLDIWKGS